MSLDTKIAKALTAPTFGLVAALAVMPPTPNMAVMPSPELRPKAGPVEVRTPRR